MSDLYQRTYRGYLVDHHSPDPPVVTLHKLDANEYEAFFRESRINTLMLYCKDHWGVTYYDSKIGRRHPGLDKDWIAELTPILARNGIEFNAYYSIEYDSLAVNTHPEWSALKANGDQLKCASPIAKWGVGCYETGYRSYVLEQLEEIVSMHRPDSLFLDIFGKSLCYCDHCRTKFHSRYGMALPEDEAGLKAQHQHVSEFLEDCATEMYRDILRVVKGIDPTLKVTINFAALYHKELRDLLDYQFTEPWAGNWLSAAYARDTAIGQYPQLGPGDVSEVYNYKPENVYKLAAAQIAAQGCRVFMYSGSQHTDGTLEHEEARRVGSAYAEVAKFEPLLNERTLVADIAIVQSDVSAKIKSTDSILPNAIGRLKAGSRHREGVLGAMKICDRLNYTWQIVPEQTLTKASASRYKAIVLPNVYHVSDALAEVLDEYVRGGGLLVSAGESGLFDAEGRPLEDFRLAALYGCRYVRHDERYSANPWSGYLQLNGSPMWEHVPKTTPPVSPLRLKVEAKEGEALATYIDPTVLITATTWVNWWSPPPRETTDEPAVVRHSHGAGTVIYAAFDLFRMEGEFHYVTPLVQGIFESNLSDAKMRLVSEHPGTVGFVGYDRPTEKALIVHEVSHLAQLTQGEAPPIAGGTLKLSESWKNIRRAELAYPESKELNVRRGSAGYEIDLPQLTIHQIAKVYYE